MMRTIGLILTLAGLLLAGGVTLFYPVASPPLSAAEELRRNTLQLNMLTGAQPVDRAELQRLSTAGQTDLARLETRSRLTMLGLGMGGIGALLILAGAITSVARKSQV